MNLFILGVLLIGNEAQPHSPACRANGHAEIKIQGSYLQSRGDDYNS